MPHEMNEELRLRDLSGVDKVMKIMVGSLYSLI